MSCNLDLPSISRRRRACAHDPTEALAPWGGPGLRLRPTTTLEPLDELRRRPPGRASHTPNAHGKTRRARRRGLEPAQAAASTS
eukprot:2724565-Alexandrium_andersonii.AAC.1